MFCKNTFLAITQPYISGTEGNIVITELVRLIFSADLLNFHEVFTTCSTLYKSVSNIYATELVRSGVKSKKAGLSAIDLVLSTKIP